VKQLLNTLYVTTQGTYLARQRESILVRVERETQLCVPIHNLGSIVCFGRVSCSPKAMELCAQNNVALSFLTERGRFLARVVGATSGNVLLRREQYRSADDQDRSAQIARDIVTAKVANGRNVLLRAARERGEQAGAKELKAAANRLALTLDDLSRPLALDVVRGHEGDAARIYFGTFDHLITAQKEEFFFKRRSRRPPLDNVNTMLSFLYTILSHDTIAALECVGLDPAVGYLHRDRPGRPGLALDLMEEFRPFLADRLVLSLINRKQVGPSGFQATESGAVRMKDDTRKEVLVAYQKRKQEEITHPFIEEKIPIGLLPHVQAQLFSRFLRGDLDAYPPFIWK